MSTTVDGFKIFSAIGDHPDVFQALRSEVDKTASGMIKKILKDKSTGIAEFRAISQAVGDDIFGLTLDGLSEKDLLAIAKKLDKHHPELIAASSQWLGGHLRDLGASKAEPMQKLATQPKSARATPSAKPKQPKAKSAPAMPRSMMAKPSRMRKGTA